MRFKSNEYRSNAVSPRGNEPIVLNCKITIPNATILTDGDILGLCKIPQGAEVVGLTLHSGDLDESTALVFSVGLCDSTDAALETVFVATSSLGQAGGTLGVPATATMFTTGPIAAEKDLAIEITTTAGAACAAERVLGAVVTYRQVNL
jgi:hypothetical protein